MDISQMLCLFSMACAIMAGALALLPNRSLWLTYGFSLFSIYHIAKYGQRRAPDRIPDVCYTSLIIAEENGIL